MKRVTGIGGIFFKAKDAPALQAWYNRHLGIDVQDWSGTAFTWADSDGKPTGCNVLDKSKVVARCRPEDQPGLLKPPHVSPMNFTGRVMKGWLYVTGPSTKKVAGLRTSISR